MKALKKTKTVLVTFGCYFFFLGTAFGNDEPHTYSSIGFAAKINRVLKKTIYQKLKSANAGAVEQISVRISTGNDDVEEYQSGGMYRNSSDIELVNDGGDNQTVGLRFRNLEISQGATVLSAYLVFDCDEASSGATNIIIRGEDKNNSSGFTSSNNNVTNRTVTSSSVNWNNIEPWTIDNEYQSPDIAPVIQEIIDRGGWACGNNLSLIISGTGSRVAESFEGSPTEAALLVVEICGGTCSGGSGNGNGSLSVRISNGNDDAEEKVSDGDMYLTSSDLEMVMDGSKEQLVGMRFRNISIPQGSRILNAYLEFEADESDSGTSNLTIFGENTDYANIFSNVDYNISSRSKTAASVNWNNLPSWSKNSTYQTPDISSIIEEIVARPNWESGNPMVILVEGFGARVAESYNGESNEAPLLFVNYCTPAEACELESAGAIATCDDNGTPDDATDDTYTFTLNPIGSRLGNSYSISGDITDSNLPYGTNSNSFGPFLINGGSKNIIITDDNDGTCDFETVIAAPATCSVNANEICYSIAQSSNGRLYSWTYDGGPSAVMEFVGSLGVGEIESMTLNHDGSYLYAVNANRLGTVDFSTGEFTAYPNTFGYANGDDGNININDVDGLAMNNRTGLLFGTHRRESSGQHDLLVKINPATGTVVKDAFGTGVDYVQIIGALEDMDDIAFNPITLELYGISTVSGESVYDKVVTIDTLSGETTVMATLNTCDIEGLSFNNVGQLFGTTGSSSCSGSSNNSLYAIDLASETATQIEDFEAFSTSGTDVEACACLVSAPKPPTPFPAEVYFDCTEGKVIDVYGSGMYAEINSIEIPNPEHMESVLVEVIFQDDSAINVCSPSGNITIHAGGDSQTLGGQTLSTQGVPVTNGGKAYRAWFDGNFSSVTVSNTSGCNPYSVVAFVIRNEGSGTASNFYVDESFRANEEDVRILTLPIGEADNLRDVTVTIPIIGLTNNAQVAHVATTVGSVTSNQDYTTWSNDFGQSLNIVNLSLSNVPANADSVIVEIKSPASSASPSGDAFMVGGVSVSATCPEACDNYITGGTIGINGEGCESFNPSIITQQTFPTGGFGTTEYQWQTSMDNINWTVINGGNASNYDPATISQTTYFRRGIKREGCTNFIYSNVVVQAIVENIIDAGTITGTESDCGSFDPTQIMNGTSPSGGMNGTIQYQWQESLDNSNWSDISNSDSENFDPGTITQSTYFRRGARRSPCSLWLYSNSILKEIINNYSSGGLISGEETNCNTFDPSPIVNAGDPTGGNDGVAQIQWQSSFDGVSFADITGATEYNYDPSEITQTTHYRRNARRTPCDSWINSNVITKTITPCVEICGNGLDDDGDLLTDCEDPDCQPTLSFITSEDNCGSSDGSIDLTITSPNSPYRFEWSDMQESAHYTFENTVDDVSGNDRHNNGVTGSLAYSTDAVEGNYSLILNGSNTVRYSVDGNFMETGFSELSIAFWIKPDALSGYQMLFEEGGSTNGLTIQLNGPILEAGVRFDGADTEVNPGSHFFPSNGQWHHVALVFDNGSIALYLDGISGAIANSTYTSMANHGNNGGIGNSFSGCSMTTCGSYYSGKMDDFRYFFEKALTPNQISDLADNTGDRTGLMAGNYGVTAYDSEGCFVIDNIFVQGNGNFTDAGAINSDEEDCGSFNPSIITEATVPSGGSGSVDYQWQSSTDGINWEDIPEANSDTYDPLTITQTTHFRRGVKRSHCPDWLYSNEVIKTVVTNYSDPGSISGAEEFCDDFDPGLIESVSVPDGGNGGMLTYKWQFSIDGNNWSDLTNSNSESFDPTNISQTTYFRRGAQRSPCSNWVFTNSIRKTVVDNFTDPGAISGEEEQCGNYDPTVIGNITEPSGGSFGTLTYQWQKSIDGGTSWEDIIGATSDSFDPGTVTETSIYRRGVRRSSCADWLFSNTVTKTVTINFTDAGVISGDESDCTGFQSTPITTISLPSGGYEGMIVYQWELSLDKEDWIEISGATDTIYDPGYISNTSYFRRKARRLPCTNWVNSNTISKIVFDSPIADFQSIPIGSNGYLCELISYTFEAVDEGPDVVYSWDFGAYADPQTATGKGPHLITFDVPDDSLSTNVLVQLTINQDGCIGGNSVDFDIKPQAIIEDLDFNNPTTCGATDGSIVIAAEHPLGSSVQASIDGGMTWGNNDVMTFSNLQQGNYNIHIRYDNGDCQEDYGPVTISDPPDPGATLSISEDEICLNSTVVFTAIPVSGSPTYSWTFGNGAAPASATGAGPHSVTYLSEGNKTATLTMVEGFCTTNLTAEMTIVSNVTYGGSILGDEALCGTNMPTEITSGASPAGGFSGTIEYQWEESNNASNWSEIVGATDANLSPSTVSETTFYRRKVRRGPCLPWVFSNTVTKVISSPPVANDDLFSAACPGFSYFDDFAGNDNNLSNPNYTIITPPANGVVELITNGEFVYTPNSTFCGNDEFTYQVCNDGTDCCDEATVVIDLTDTEDPTLENIPADITINCDEFIPLLPLVEAVENCQSVSLGLDEVSTQGADSCSLINYVLTRNWIAIDYCGNSLVNQQKITVEDKTAPDIYRIYTLPNGKKMVAGVMENVTTRWKTITLPIQFTTPPVVLSQVVSKYDNAAVVTRLKNISTTQFQMMLQEEENGDGFHLEEDVAWIAFEQGINTEGIPFEVGRSTVSSNSTALNFSQNYNFVPSFIGGIQTTNEEDPVALRYNNLSTSGVNILLEEENSFDPETTHGLEFMGYFAFGNTGNITTQTGEIIGEVGQIDINQDFTSIDLAHTYHNPVVVLGGMSQNETDAATIRVKDVTQNSFSVQIEEWENGDQVHALERVSYVVVEGSIPFDTEAECTALPESPALYQEIVVVDNCDYSVHINYTESPINFDCVSDTTITRTWSAVDECGNFSEFSQNIILRDTTPPTFTVPDAVIVTCGQSTEPDSTGVVTDEYDNCSSDLLAVYTDNLGNLKGCEGFIQRIWSLTDDCGNTQQKSQIIWITNPDNGDKDPTPNSFDHDDDNDGIPDVDETSADSDGDGITNDLDLDSDNDGIPDLIEAGGMDRDGNGIIDNFLFEGWDSDGDGFAEGYDANDNDTSLVGSDNFDALIFQMDRDQDGIPNYLDLDSDNDGIPDIIEAGGVDENGDGRVDYPTNNDPLTMEDGDGDGFADVYDPDDDGLANAEDVFAPLIIRNILLYQNGNPSMNPDPDNDNIPDMWDLDSDNDGIPDLLEAGGVDEDGDGQIDAAEFVDLNSDGLHDNYAMNPLIRTEPDGTVIDGRPEDLDGNGTVFIGGDEDNDNQINSRDPDSDNDGIPDIVEIGNRNDDNNLDGRIDNPIDNDQNGFDDTKSTAGQLTTEPDGTTDDGRPEDSADLGNSPFSSNADDGSFGEENGEPDIDDDGDGKPNFLDLDSDDDMILDKNEDKNGNGIQDPGERIYLDKDSDDDMLLDGIEDTNLDGDLDIGETDPLNKDTDYDGYDDGLEDENHNGILDFGEIDPRDPCDPDASESCIGVGVDIKVKLQGALMGNGGGGLMRDDLRAKGFIPLVEPYSQLNNITHVNGGGGEVIDESILDITGNDAMVDWVVVELRSPLRADSIIATRSGILQRDGDVVHIDGESNIRFEFIPSGNYYVAIRHRNHLGLITKDPYFLSPEPVEIDFTNSVTNLYGDFPATDINGERLLWSGDLNRDKFATYQGPQNDIMSLFFAVMFDTLNTEILANYISSGYLNEDLNMDGQVIFQGPDNDRSKMLFNVTLASPENTNSYVNFVVGEDLPENDNGTVGNPCLTGATAPSCDFDGDGIKNGDDPDDDNDGVKDDIDINPYNPESDTDGDGLSDFHETGRDGVYNPGIDTNPLSVDTDDDMITDDREDLNRNGFVDVGETNPIKADTDGDGILDGIEDSNQNGIYEVGETDPLSLCDPITTFDPCDFDGDRIPNYIDLDTDNDGVRNQNDLDDFNPNSDSDGDGVSDNSETGNDGVYNPMTDSNPLDTCDPNPANLNCVGVDLDDDGYFSNYPVTHGQYDADDYDACVPDANACVNQICEDLDGDGFITICHNTTSTEYTTEVEASIWEIHEGHDDYCGPCADFKTIASGLWTDPSTWEGGNVPPTTINNKGIIINHPVTVQSDLILTGNTYLWVENSTLAIQNAKLRIEDGDVTFLNSTVDIGQNLELTQANSKLTVNGGALAVGQLFTNNGGKRHFENACLTIFNTYTNFAGTDVFKNTCIESGNGDFKNELDGTISFENSEIHLTNGHFQNNGLLEGSISAIWLENGDLRNLNSWNTQIDNYCVSGDVAVLQSFLPDTEECLDITGSFPCSCN
jgi:hypothetical protein